MASICCMTTLLRWLAALAGMFRVKGSKVMARPAGVPGVGVGVGVVVAEGSAVDVDVKVGVGEGTAVAVSVAVGSSERIKRRRSGS